MRIQFNETVKATVGNKREMWVKGKILDDSVKPIPRVIKRMAEEGDKAVTVLGEIAAQPTADPNTQLLMAELEQASAKLQDELATMKARPVPAAPVFERFVCPVCQKEFPSQRGVSAHITKMHPDYVEANEGQ